MDWQWQRLLQELVATVVFSLVGLVVCVIFFLILVHISPFSIRKEIEQDQNISLGLIIGAAIIGIAIIISSAMHG
jgi:putative membrane protein